MHTFNRFNLLALLLLVITAAHGQHSHNHVHGRNCAAHDVLQQQIQQDPARQQQLRQLENATQQYIRTHGNSRNNQTRIIPVYVHVLYRTSQENISTAQIQSQIDVMNRDFAAANTDITGVPSYFQSVTAGNSGIQFELVNITRKQTSKSSWGTNDAMKFTAQGGVAPITPSTHLNLWVCNIGGGILGYAQFPGGSSSTDGVVISPQYFGNSNATGGSNFYLANRFDGGRTAVHEVGHYLNLRHIWGDGGCSADDFVDDTPIAGQSNNGCPSPGTNTCSGGLSDMFMNYMDYVDDDCMFMFSDGQVARMWATLNTTRSSLGYAGSTGGGGNTGGCNDIEVTLNLNFDQYGSETSWQLKNAAGATVASGSGYTNSSADVTETFCLADGCYDFVINDAYGDGICCAYGNGSYSLTDAAGAVLASGGSFASTETKQICVSSAPPCVEVDFALNFDQYGSETSWTIKDANGVTVESGNGYTNSSANVNETFCLDAGCYTFQINDTYGDGICCSYGNGSYTLSSNGSTLASGGSFASSQTRTFCVGGASSRLDNGNNENEIGQFQPIMNLYPNPARAYVSIELLNIEETVIGTIQDATGKQLWQGDLDEGENRINIQNLPAGLYYFRAVQNSGKVITKKFVKS